MSEPSPQDITDLLNQYAEGDKSRLADQLVPLLYDDLRRLAGKYFRGERPDHTLQPTALVHEAYMRLVDQSRVKWESRAHFFAAAARTMRRVLVDYARGKKRVRRGGGRPTISLDDDLSASQMSADDLLSLHDAIEKLAQLDARQAHVVELRYFGGLSMDEIAQALNVSKRSVEGDWTHAKAWLRTEFGGEPA